MMRIGEAAVRSGVSTQAIRFYERRGLLGKPARLASGYREYAARHVTIIQFIKRSQELGFTLKEIGQLLRLREVRGENAKQVRAIAEERLRILEDRIRLLELTRDRLAQGLERCKCGDGQPRCLAIDSLDFVPNQAEVRRVS